MPTRQHTLNACAAAQSSLTVQIDAPPLSVQPAMLRLQQALCTLVDGRLHSNTLLQACTACTATRAACVPAMALMRL